MCDSKETELIGGAEIYKPVCRGCFNKKESLNEPLTENLAFKENINASNISQKILDDSTDTVEIPPVSSLKSTDLESQNTESVTK